MFHILHYTKKYLVDYHFFFNHSENVIKGSIVKLKPNSQVPDPVQQSSLSPNRPESEYIQTALTSTKLHGFFGVSSS